MKWNAGLVIALRGRIQPGKRSLGSKFDKLSYEYRWIILLTARVFLRYRSGGNFDFPWKIPKGFFFFFFKFIFIWGESEGTGINQRHERTVTCSSLMKGCLRRQKLWDINVAEYVTSRKRKEEKKNILLCVIWMLLKKHEFPCSVLSLIFLSLFLTGVCLKIFLVCVFFYPVLKTWKKLLNAKEFFYLEGRRNSIQLYD